LLKRTSINIVNKILEKESNWKVLDIGCGYTANKNANTIADIQDLSKFYKDRNFVKITNDKLPFKDKEFDFVISSHVIEHVDNFEFFIKELERISSKGYIELPTRFADNLIFENKNDHIWWFVFDDANNRLIASKKNQLIEPFLNVSTGKIFEKSFRESFVLELMWNDSIEYKIDDSIRNYNFEKISFYKLIKKYLSKRVRSLLKN
tara:strand:+ start:606 stop:1223 length:618 start_codon:yes stop_codon:yes gene_type:complete